MLYVVTIKFANYIFVFFEELKQFIMLQHVILLRSYDCSVIIQMCECFPSDLTVHNEVHKAACDVLKNVF